MKIEIWKDVAGYEQHYQVSNLGRVKSLDRVKENYKTFVAVGGRILKQIKRDRTGHLYVNLCKDGLVKKHSVHSVSYTHLTLPTICSV